MPPIRSLRQPGSPFVRVGPTVLRRPHSWAGLPDATVLAPRCYYDAVWADGPISFWTLGEQPGATTAVDEKGLQNGTYNNTPTLGIGGPTADPFTAVAFDQASSENITVASSAPYQFAGLVAFSVEVWMRKDVTDAIYRRFMDVDDGSNRGWYLYAGPGYGFVRRSATVTDDVGHDPAQLGYGWHHYVATFDGSNMRVYSDAQLVAGPLASTASLPSTTTFHIGGSASSSFWNGSLALPAIYDKALSAAQIEAHYAARTGLCFDPRFPWATYDETDDLSET